MVLPLLLLPVVIDSLSHEWEGVQVLLLLATKGLQGAVSPMYIFVIVNITKMLLY